MSASVTGAGATAQLWVVRASDGVTRAVAGPSVATDVAGGANVVSPPLAFEPGDSIAVTALPRPGTFTSVGIRVTPGTGATRAFAPGFTALDSPLTTSRDGVQQMQFNADVVLAPTVTETSPAIGPSSGGTSVTITGRDLDGATGVSFGGAPASSFAVVSPTTITATAPAGTGGSTVDVTVTGPGGTSAAVPGARFSYAASLTPPPPVPDTTAPRLTELAISPRAFFAAAGGPSAVAARAAGGVVTYRLSEAARTTFSVKRKQPGLEVGRTCIKATRRVRAQLRGRPRRCDVLASVRGSFSRDGVEGSNRFRFTGRLGRRSLPPGRYVLVAATRDAAGVKGRTRTAAFAILAR